LKKESAEENLIFYECVQKYKSLGWTDRKIYAKEILEIFFEKNAKFELNTLQIKNKIIENLEHRDKDLFDSVLKNTLSMLKFDVLKRFLEEQMKL